MLAELAPAAANAQDSIHPIMEHILVDGYNILHQWTEFARARRSSLAKARQALIHLLTQFHDCHGGRMTLVFDGRSAARGDPSLRTNIEIIYSRQGESADAVIERVVGRSANPANFVVATDDRIQQSTVESFGARAISADMFHDLVESELDNLSGVLDGITARNRPFGRR